MNHIPDSLTQSQFNLSSPRPPNDSLFNLLWKRTFLWQGQSVSFQPLDITTKGKPEQVCNFQKLLFEPSKKGLVLDSTETCFFGNLLDQIVCLDQWVRVFLGEDATILKGVIPRHCPVRGKKGPLLLVFNVLSATLSKKRRESEDKRASNLERNLKKSSLLAKCCQCKFLPRKTEKPLAGVSLRGLPK